MYIKKTMQRMDSYKLTLVTVAKLLPDLAWRTAI